jgi:hypothetical protein
MGQYYKPVNTEKSEYVYSHDYGNGLKLLEHSWIGNDFVSAVENLIKKDGKWYKNRIIWAGDYAETEPGEDGNWFDLANKKIYPPVIKDKTHRYLVNMDTKEFVDLKKVPFDNDQMRLHPLPILTCEGNGNGGGDLHPERAKGNTKLIGSWARNRVTIRQTRPKKNRGYVEIKFDIVEKR